MTARVIPINHRRRPKTASTTIRAVPGFVVIEAAGCQPMTFTAEDAVALAHAIETVALSARGMGADGKGRR